jgi:hypothetical protein
MANANNAFNVLSPETVAIPPKAQKQTLIPSKEISFDLSYSGSFLSYPYSFGACPVKIRCEDSRRIITITQRPNVGTTSVTNAIEHIATQLYYGFLKGTDPTKLYFNIRMEEVRTWEKPYEYSQVLYWDGTRFLYNKPAASQFDWKNPLRSLRKQRECALLISTSVESQD